MRRVFWLLVLRRVTGGGRANSNTARRLCGRAREGELRRSLGTCTYIYTDCDMTSAWQGWRSSGLAWHWQYAGCRLQPRFAVRAPYRTCQSCPCPQILLVCRGTGPRYPTAPGLGRRHPSAVSRRTADWPLLELRRSRLLQLSCDAFQRRRGVELG
jgi:hypothetical protein